MGRQEKKNRKRQALERKRRKKRKERLQNRSLSPADQPKLTPRGEYILFEHPRKIVEIEFPADWKWGMKDDTRSTTFHPAGREDVALNCYVLPVSINLEGVADESRLADGCNLFFQKAKAVNPRRDAIVPYFCMIADRNQEGVGGNYRMVIACDIVMGISTYCPEEELHIWEPVFERMLSTFRIPRELEGLFAKTALRLCCKLNEADPQAGYKVSAGFQLKGKRDTLPLGNLLTRVKADPDRWEALVDEYAETLGKLSTAELGKEPLDEVRDEIFPFIRRDSWGDQADGRIKTEWLADLAVAYVLRIQAGFRYINEYDLERWKLDREELHQIAIANLSELEVEIARPEMPLIDVDLLPIKFIAGGDNMEASRLLHPGLYAAFAETFGGPFVAAIPCRDVLVLFPNDKEIRRRTQRTVRWDYERSDYAITDRLFLVTADGVTLAEW